MYELGSPRPACEPGRLETMDALGLLEVQSIGPLAQPEIAVGVEQGEVWDHSGYGCVDALGLCPSNHSRSLRS